jgi:hypothetical protein
MLQRFALKAGVGAGWELTDQEGAVVRIFNTKADALASGVLEKTVSQGTVRIHNEDGTIAEERTYPRAADPRQSPG